ncbi:serine/threonine protein kinase [Elsinoe ampelina]|uniref:mitogen-activated protein kinase n=1 Tax=Elsinoe ampelina TaxID=302913 RepID=A0A6A6GQU1_9PEZI|nr:serine/threonine protein kinase [Elsinoe ampelina]
MMLPSCIIDFDWILSEQPALRSGRYGPVFSAMSSSDGQLLWAERVELQSSVVDQVLSHLRHTPKPAPDQNLVQYLGYQQQGDALYLFSEALHGGSLRRLIREQGALPLPIIQRTLRYLVNGLVDLQLEHGFAVAYLDPDHIWLDYDTRPQIELPILDTTLVGYRFPSAFISLPEIARGQGINHKSDVFLLGIITAQLLSGQADLVADYETATAFVARLAHGQAAAVDLLLPDHKPSNRDQLAMDFLGKCLTVEVEKRPSVRELQGHPFMEE